jgi:hypothetical protein
VTTPRDTDDRLKDAFRALDHDAEVEASAPDVERVWRAVNGELPAAERRDLVERLASEPALAKAWQVANELRLAQVGDSEPASERPARSWTPAWLGLAALLVLSVGVGLYQLRSGTDVTFRDSGRYVVEPLIASDAALPRDAFILRWKPGPEGSRYQVRVTTEDLRVLASAADLTTPEVTIPAAALADVKPNTRVLWQVAVGLPGGDTVSSQTYIVRVQ